MNNSDLPSGKNLHVHIAVSDWNTEITDKLLNASLDYLTEAGVLKENIRIVRVPGSFELPFAAKTIIKSHKTDAVICLGCVIKGETQHDEYINNAIALGITQLSLATDIPVIFGVLTVNDMQQAQDRSGGTHGNKGTEAAHTALRMIQMKNEMGGSKSNIGF